MDTDYRLQSEPLAAPPAIGIAVIIYGFGERMVLGSARRVLPAVSRKAL